MLSVWANICVNEAPFPPPPEQHQKERHTYFPKRSHIKWGHVLGKLSIRLFLPEIPTDAERARGRWSFALSCRNPLSDPQPTPGLRKPTSQILDDARALSLGDSPQHTEGGLLPEVAAVFPQTGGSNQQRRELAS